VSGVRFEARSNGTVLIWSARFVFTILAVDVPKSIDVMPNIFIQHDSRGKANILGRPFEKKISYEYVDKFECLPRYSFLNLQVQKYCEC